MRKNIDQMIHATEAYAHRFFFDHGDIAGTHPLWPLDNRKMLNEVQICEPQFDGTKGAGRLLTTITRQQFYELCRTNRNTVCTWNLKSMRPGVHIVRAHIFNGKQSKNSIF